MSQIFHLCVIEMTLVEPAEELLYSQDLEYFTQVCEMVFWRLTVDENVIQVNQDTLPYLLGKDLIHKRLEYCWSIRQTKRQDLELIESLWGPKCRLLTIFGLYPDLIVALHQVDR